MHHIILSGETDFDGWRKAARTLALHEVEPSAVTWSVRSNAPELFEPSVPPLEASPDTFSVSAKFVELAQAAILHRDPLRFAILYRLLWRLRGDHDLLGVADDARCLARFSDGEGRLAAHLRQYLQSCAAENDVAAIIAAHRINIPNSFGTTNCRDRP